MTIERISPEEAERHLRTKVASEKTGYTLVVYRENGEVKIVYSFPEGALQFAAKVQGHAFRQHWLAEYFPVKG